MKVIQLILDFSMLVMIFSLRKHKRQLTLNFFIFHFFLSRRVNAFTIFKAKYKIEIKNEREMKILGKKDK
jgi:hypothetical protein